MARKTRKQKIAYQKRQVRRGKQAVVEAEVYEELSQKEDRSRKYGEVALRFNVRENGDRFSHETEQFRMKKYLGMSFYSMSSVSGGLSGYEDKSKLDWRIGQFRADVEHTNPKYVFLDLEGTSKEFKNYITGKLEDLVTKFPSKFEEFRTRAFMPVPYTSRFMD